MLERREPNAQRKRANEMGEPLEKDKSVCNSMTKNEWKGIIDVSLPERAEEKILMQDGAEHDTSK